MAYEKYLKNPIELSFSSFHYAPSISGVYFILSSQEELLYIGFSDNINSRLVKYKNNRLNTGLFHKVKIYPYEDLMTINFFEEYCIKKYKPSMNNIYNEQFNRNNTTKQRKTIDNYNLQEYAAVYKFGNTKVKVVAPPPMLEEEKEEILRQMHQVGYSILQEMEEKGE